MLENRPRLMPGAEPYYEAFVILHGSRGAGFDGPQPISFADIAAYQATLGTPGGDPRRFVRLIQAADTGLLDYVTRKRAAEAGRR